MAPGARNSGLSRSKLPVHQESKPSDNRAQALLPGRDIQTETGKGPIAVHNAEHAHYEKAISKTGIYPLISQKYREKQGMILFLNSRFSNWAKISAELQ